jgi:hypothetical protein
MAAYNGFNVPGEAENDSATYDQADGEAESSDVGGFHIG